MAPKNKKVAACHSIKIEQIYYNRNLQCIHITTICNAPGTVMHIHSSFGISQLPNKLTGILPHPLNV